MCSLVNVLTIVTVNNVDVQGVDVICSVGATAAGSVEANCVMIRRILQYAVFANVATVVGIPMWYVRCSPAWRWVLVLRLLDAMLAGILPEGNGLYGRGSGREFNVVASAV